MKSKGRKHIFSSFYSVQWRNGYIPSIPPSAAQQALPLILWFPLILANRYINPQWEIVLRFWAMKMNIFTSILLFYENLLCQYLIVKVKVNFFNNNNVCLHNLVRVFSRKKNYRDSDVCYRVSQSKCHFLLACHRD